MQHAKNHNFQNWDVKFVGAAITLYKDIWDAQDKHIHEQTKKNQSHHNTKRSRIRSLTFIDTHQASHHVTNQLDRSHYQLDYKVALNI
jgi:hypothetical protein